MVEVTPSRAYSCSGMTILFASRCRCSPRGSSLPFQRVPKEALLVLGMLITTWPHRLDSKKVIAITT